MVNQNETRSLLDRAEAFIANLAARNNFWHRVCAWIWLPLAFRSGIAMRQKNGEVSAFLPFRRFNRNWYNAMAGAALLGNSEIAGGMFLFKQCEGQCRVVCKELTYKFLRPCIGPATYHMGTNEDLQELLEAGTEFNVSVDIKILQVPKDPNAPKCVGRCTVLFHATPIRLDKERIAVRKQRVEARTAPTIVRDDVRPLRRAA